MKLRAVVIDFVTILAVMTMLVPAGNFTKSDPPKKNLPEAKKEEEPDQLIRYVPMGDSYTFGNGSETGRSWPRMLSDRLVEDKVNIELTENLAVNGYTSRQLLDEEMPRFEELKPDFTTILIGTNDLFQEDVDIETYRNHYTEILNRAQDALTHEDAIILYTIPNYSVTLRDNTFEEKQLQQTRIMEFNDVIRELAEERDLEVIELFEISEAMGTDETLHSPDFLHPSSKEYLIWVDEMYPTTLSILFDQFK